MNLKSIYYSPAQINLYDSTNGLLFCGYLEPDDFDIEQDELVHKIINGQRYQYGTRTEFKAVLKETNPEMWQDIRDRMDDLVDVYIICQNVAFKFKDIYINARQVRDLSIGGKQNIVLSGATDDVTAFEIIKNILSSVKDTVDYGNMNTDGDPSGVSLGWTNSGYTATRVASWLSGGGSCQKLEETSGTSSFYCRMHFPIDTFQIRITLSFYYYNAGAAPITITNGFRLVNNAGSVISTHTQATGVADLEQSLITYSSLIVPTAQARYIDAYFETTGAIADLRLDNVQIEFGNFTAYSEND